MLEPVLPSRDQTVTSARFPQLSVGFSLELCAPREGGLLSWWRKGMSCGMGRAWVCHNSATYIVGVSDKVLGGLPFPQLRAKVNGTNLASWGC